MAGAPAAEDEEETRMFRIEDTRTTSIGLSNERREDFGRWLTTNTQWVNISVILQSIQASVWTQTVEISCLMRSQIDQLTWKRERPVAPEAPWGKKDVSAAVFARLMRTPLSNR